MICVIYGDNDRSVISARRPAKELRRKPLTEIKFGSQKSPKERSETLLHIRLTYINILICVPDIFCEKKTRKVFWKRQE